MSEPVIIESKDLIWTTDLPKIPEGKPYALSIKMCLDGEVRELYAAPAAAPHLYAQTPDELTGTAAKRQAIIAVVPDACNTLVASHRPTNGHIYHHKIRLMGTGDMLYWFPELENARDSVLRGVFQAHKERFADRWTALALDARLSKKGPKVLTCFSRRGNEFWLRDSGMIKPSEELQFEVPQRFRLGRFLLSLVGG